MGQAPGEEEGELQEPHSESDVQTRDVAERDERQESLIARLRREAELREGDLAMLLWRLEAAERELVDLRAVRDALTPPDLPKRPGVDLAASFLPAAAEQVSGDFYLVAEGPQHATVLVVGDVIGHGPAAARRAVFARTAFAATAPFSDDPCRLLSWANAALIERAGTSSDFATVACVTYLPHERRLRWAYAGHPPAVWLDDGRRLLAPKQGSPLGIGADLACVEGSCHVAASAGVLLYTDGLTEARRDGKLFGAEAVSAALAGLQTPSPNEALAILRARVAEFAYGALTDDLCMLAARFT
jgi:sigma-B regulation protein RsbU (phosphoserine phosphatase)